LSFEWFSVSNQTSHSPALRKTNKATAKTTDFSDTHTNNTKHYTHIPLHSKRGQEKGETDTNSGFL